MALRDQGLEQSSLVVALVAKRSEEFLLVAGAKLLNAEDTTYKHGSAEHHGSEQWLVGVLRVSQVVSSCVGKQCNVARLVLLTEK